MSIEQQFQEYHAANPQIFEQYEHFAQQAFHFQGRIGAKALSERIRWETAVKGTGVYKIQNSFVSLYARLLMWKHPRYRQMFSLRHIPVDGASLDIYDVNTWDHEYWDSFA